MSSTILILHSTLQPGAGPDEQDTLDAVRDVTAALESEGFIAAAAGFVPDLDAVRATVAAHRPACVFNLVESVEGRSDLVHLAPAFLDAIGVPYTGCTAETLLLTGDKIAASQWITFLWVQTYPLGFYAPVVLPMLFGFMVTSMVSAVLIVNDRSELHHEPKELFGLMVTFMASNVPIEEYQPEL